MGEQQSDSMAPRRPPEGRRRFSGPEETVLAAIAALLFTVLYREFTGAETLLQIGAFDLGAADPAFILTCLAALRCWLARRPHLNLATIPGLILAALIGLSFVRGVARDPFMGFIWLRSGGFLAPLMIIAATLPPRAATFAAIRTMIVATGTLLALLVLLRMTIDMSLFFTVDIGDPHDVNDGGRALANRGAMILGLALVLTMGALLRPSRAAAAPAAALLASLAIALVLSQQATAIIATATAVLALIVLERPFRDRSVIGIGVILIAALLTLTSASWIDALPASLQGMIRHRVDNLGTRQAVWDGFSTKYATLSATDRLIGIPAGSDPALIVFLSGHWRSWQYSLHSMYVGLMSSVGLAGLSAYVALLLAGVVISAFLARAGSRIGSFTPALSIAILLLAAIESYSYDLRQESLVMVLLPTLFVAQARWARPALWQKVGRRSQDRPAGA